jgi:hypothetical protein
MLSVTFSSFMVSLFAHQVRVRRHSVFGIASALAIGSGRNDAHIGGRIGQGANSASFRLEARPWFKGRYLRFPRYSSHAELHGADHRRLLECPTSAAGGVCWAATKGGWRKSRFHGQGVVV